jgi:superfamily I DNA/RNA helicase
VSAALEKQEFFTRAGVYRHLGKHYASAGKKPFDHIVVDEAQDLGPPELAFLAAVSPQGGDGLFFAGDIGQRIFQHPFSWRALGVNVRGRSANLKVCYRTSRQIRAMADHLLPAALRDPDGNEKSARERFRSSKAPYPRWLPCTIRN